MGDLTLDPTGSQLWLLTPCASSTACTCSGGYTRASKLALRKSLKRAPAPRLALVLAIAWLPLLRWLDYEGICSKRTVLRPDPGSLTPAPPSLGGAVVQDVP